MTEQTPVNPKARNLVTGLYQAVDDMNVEKLGSYLSEDLRFQLGNFDAVIGKQKVLEANADFFEIIESMAHSIEGIWDNGDDIVCKGQVHYTRLDKTELTLPFATVLGLKNDLIQDYQIYVDVTPL